MASEPSLASASQCPSFCTRENLHIGFLLTLVLGLNFGLNFVNKWAMTPAPDGLGYSFPLFQGFCDSTISITSMFILRLWPGFSAKMSVSFQQFWRLKFELIALSGLFALSIVANNASLVRIGLSVNQVIKGCVPLPTVICSYFLEGKRYSCRVVVAVVVMVIGSALAIPFNRPTASPDGLILALAAMLAAAVKASLSALLMSREGDKESLTPLALTFYQASVAGPCLLVIWLFSSEPPATLAYIHDKPQIMACIISSISLMATVYNVVVYDFTRVTSALTLTISGSIKLVVLIVIPAAFMDKEDSLLNWIGTGLFFAALFYYSWLGYTRQDKEGVEDKEADGDMGAQGKGEPVTVAVAKETTPLTAGDGGGRPSQP